MTRPRKYRVCDPVGLDISQCFGGKTRRFLSASWQTRHSGWRMSAAWEMADVAPRAFFDDLP
jgi:hypothetical protein